MSLLRAKSRLRRLRSVHACGRSAVGIFAFDELLRSTAPEIATPACALVRNDEGGSLRWFAMTKKGTKNPPRKKQLFRGGYRTSQEG